MQNNSAAIFIPARLNSSRFPQKILAPLNGKPLIVHVWERAMKAGIGDCYVACCCEEVKALIESHGGKAIVTDPELPSGSDRIFAAVETLAEKPKYVINLQGDTPFFEPKMLSSILEVLSSNDEIDIATPVSLSRNQEDFQNENHVKVVFNNMDKNQPGKAFYFSRNLIPHGTDYIYSHIGMYAYKYEALKKFVNLAPSYLEVTERLEQLRALQNDFNIWAVPVEGRAIAVDVRSDVYEVLKYL